MFVVAAPFFQLCIYRMSEALAAYWGPEGASGCAFCVLVSLWGGEMRHDVGEVELVFYTLLDWAAGPGIKVG